MREDYVRPVTGAREARSTAFAVWRFRVVLFGLLLLLGILAAVLGAKLTNQTQDPGLGRSAGLQAGPAR